MKRQTNVAIHVDVKNYKHRSCVAACVSEINDQVLMRLFSRHQTSKKICEMYELAENWAMNSKLALMIENQGKIARK